MDYFARLGLPRRFSIDAAELERAYLAHSRLVHPDYHLAGTDAERDVSLEAAAAVNEAYNTLRDPFSRAEYLLSLEREPAARAGVKLPPAFLAEMLEARERLEEARGNATAITELEQEFSGQLATMANELATLFEAANASTREKIESVLNQARYVRGLIRDLNNE